MRTKITLLEKYIILILCVGFMTGVDLKALESENSADSAPEIFLPGIVSTGLDEFDICISPDGNEIFYTVFVDGVGAIITVKNSEGIWSHPEVASFSGKYSDLSPIFHPNGVDLYFISNRPLDNNSVPEKYFNVWVIHKMDTGWSEPKALGSPVNGNWSVGSPHILEDNTLYFSKRIDGKWDGIYRALYKNGMYSLPEKLPLNISFVEPHFFHGHIDPFFAQANFSIAVDGSYLIVSSVKGKGAQGRSDLYIIQRDKDDNWSEPLNLGAAINSREYEISSFLSLDGKFLYYQSSVPKIHIKMDKSVKYPDLKNDLLKPETGSMDIYRINIDKILDLIKH
ncbi:MAG: PD40 domain-containing protein [Acidobacteria bacterium]|nr:PD40 domain-containing protein [Acidobacteriota bacterium]